MSNKKIIIIAVSVLIAIFAIMYFLSKSGTQESADVQSAESQASMNVKKNDVAKENAVFDSVKNNPQKQVFLDPAKDTVFRDDNRFSVSYYAKDKSMFITLMDPDIWTARPLAEQDFLDKFKLSKEDACALKVSLTIPYSVNADASGKDYGLSFCPYGKPLPKR